MPYRSDITGLRAIAVLAVLIFHIFPKTLWGGYLGVDMFFVISGYLITLSLIQEKEKTGTISLIGFYKRRIFRIAPATLLTIALVCVFATVFMDNAELRNTLKSALYAVFGLANIYFYKYLDISYFAKDIGLNPLLHLWSLGVEEQFYFIFPLFFILFSRYKKLLWISLAILAIASVVGASIISHTHHMFAYYMLPTRAFGLIAGCLSAIYCSAYYKNINQKIATITATLSGIFIILALAMLSRKYVLPNYLSLIVVIPTALLIIIGHKNTTWIHKILGCRYLKHIGLWSFSIYLMHWIILFGYKYINGLHLPVIRGLIILLASIAMGGASYYLVEQTLRKKRWNIFIAIAIFILIPFAIIQIISYVANKNSSKYQALEPQFTKGNNICAQPSEIALNAEKHMLREECTHHAINEPNIILWGDSNAVHYILTLYEIGKFSNFGFRNIIHSACPPLSVPKKEGYLRNNNENHVIGGCDEASTIAYALVKKYDVVILASGWIHYETDATLKELNTTLEELSKTAKIILVLGTIPMMDNLDLKSIMHPSRFKINNNRNDVQGHINTKVFKLNDAIKDIVGTYKNA